MLIGEHLLCEQRRVRPEQGRNGLEIEFKDQEAAEISPNYFVLIVEPGSQQIGPEGR
jgi:hypothetical protein